MQKKSSAPYRVCPDFLKRYAEWISYYFTLIFEKSLHTHLLPRDWRRAVVIPVYKGGDRTLVNNYRPISLTCISCKLLEHIIAKHILKFLETNRLLYSSQQGLCAGLSTITQLIEVVHDLAAALDEKHQIDVICIDFAKAFDKVPHDKLIFKLGEIGIDERLVLQIKEYLSDRKQTVSLDGSLSIPLQVLSGVPQGWVLGLLLFLVYINDIPSVVEQLVRLKLFADD